MKSDSILLTLVAGGIIGLLLLRLIHWRPGVAQHIYAAVAGLAAAFFFALAFGLAK